DHAHARNVLLDHRGHSAVEVMHVTPLRLQLSGIEGDQAYGWQGGGESEKTEERTGSENERTRHNQRHANVHTQKQASVEKVLQPKNVGRRTRDQLPTIRLVMISKGEPLHRIV